MQRTDVLPNNTGLGRWPLVPSRISLRDIPITDLQNNKLLRYDMDTTIGIQDWDCQVEEDVKADEKRITTSR